jgi:hypothetical protein
MAAFTFLYRHDKKTKRVTLRREAASRGDCIGWRTFNPSMSRPTAFFFSICPKALGDSLRLISADTAALETSCHTTQTLSASIFRATLGLTTHINVPNASTQHLCCICSN